METLVKVAAGTGEEVKDPLRATYLYSLWLGARSVRGRGAQLCPRDTDHPAADQPEPQPQAPLILQLWPNFLQPYRESGWSWVHPPPPRLLHNRRMGRNPSAPLTHGPVFTLRVGLCFLWDKGGEWHPNFSQPTAGLPGEGQAPWGQPF